MVQNQDDETPFFQTYRRLPLRIARGDGVYLISADGTRYLDMFAGIGVNALGHCHPELVSSIRYQTERYIHLSNFFDQQPQEELARRLLAGSGYQKVFFTNSGTEAVEGALKIARKYGSAMNKAQIISFTDAFHGRTLGSLSLMDREAYRSGYGPFLEQCKVLPFNEPGALRDEIGDGTLAVITEFVQGESGIHPATVPFIRTIEELRKRHGFLLIGDEVQCGLGRTGRLFSCEHYGVKPDIIVTAKPLGGGLPLGAILGNDRVAAVLQPGTHGSTFGGNPVACAAGTVLLRNLLEGNLLMHVQTEGSFLLEGLKEIHRNFPKRIREVRGLGLMVGVEITGNAEDVEERFRARGILVNRTAAKVLRILPPLIIGREHLTYFLDSFGEILRAEQKGV